MTMQALSFRPGIDTEQTARVLEAGFTSGQWMRFRRGMPQKIGGWQKYIEEQLTGTPRDIFSWSDRAGQPLLAVGTSEKLYAVIGGTLYDITPVRTVEIVILGTDPIATTSGSTTCVITHTSHDHVVGNRVQVINAGVVGGVAIDGSYVIVTVLDTNSYEVDLDEEATATETGGGSSVELRYDQGNMDNDPFTTTGDFTAVYVRHTGHAAAAGDRVTFSGASDVGGQIINGEHRITRIFDENSYRIDLDETNPSTDSGGGNNVQATFELTVGSATTSLQGGWGVGTWGQDTWGGKRPQSSIRGELRTWALDQWGEDLLAAPVGSESFYRWRPPNVGEVPQRATYEDTPEDGAGLLGLAVSDQARHVVVLTDDLIIRWCSSEDTRAWMPTSLNSAGFISVSGGSRLVGLLRSRGQMLVWTDTSLFSLTYTGQLSSVFSTRMIGDKCGLAGGNAAVDLDGIVYWMGQDGFFVYNGAVNRISSTVDTVTLDALDVQQKAKITAAVNTRFGEIWWMLPTSTTDADCDRYVIFHPQEGWWSTGSLQRSAMIDRRSFSGPLAASPDGYIYLHEQGVDADGAPLPWDLETGAIDLSEGDTMMVTGRIIPDNRQTGVMLLSATYREYPQSDDLEQSEGEGQQNEGPFTVLPDTPYIDQRARGRQVRFKFAGQTVGSNWRMGTFRVDVLPEGRR